MKQKGVTDSSIKLFSAAIKGGASIAAAAGASGLSESSIYAWLNGYHDEDPMAIVFQLEYKKARYEFEKEKLDNIKRHEDKQWTASAWLLERRMPDQWGMNRTTIQLKKKGGDFVAQVKDVINTTKEGRISVESAQQLCDMLLTGAKIEETEKMKPLLAELKELVEQQKEEE